jgi:hypothetical protein
VEIEMGISGADACHVPSLLLTKTWQLSLGVYPFMFSSAQDFEPVFEEMVKVRSRWQSVIIINNNQPD